MLINLIVIMLSHQWIPFYSHIFGSLQVHIEESKLSVDVTTSRLVIEHLYLFKSHWVVYLNLLLYPLNPLLILLLIVPLWSSECVLKRTISQLHIVY